ncbi:MAG: hypothetical protein AAB790_02835 [Patescibacteria group bacterium]
MDAKMTQDELNEKLRERFKQLPKAVQTAVMSADVEKQLRVLADTNKLHLDQWQLLENDVMLTLFGFQPTEELPNHLKNDLDISTEMAKSLADDISRIVFQPIREQLERELAHPDAKAANVSGVEAARTQILGSEDKPAAPVAPVVLPATPPTEPPSAKIARAPVSESYKAGETSTARKSVHDDPYREPPA